jgi:hypothetical protein
VKLTRLGIVAATLAAAPGVALAQGGEQPVPAKITAFTASKSVTFGERVKMAGRVEPAQIAQIRLERKGAAGGWVPWATVRTNTKGVFKAAVPLKSSADVRARVMGVDDETTGPGTSVKVKRAVGITWEVDPTEAIAGRPIAVEAIVKPARPGERIVVEGSRGGKIWRKLSRPTVAPGGSAKGFVRLPAGGKWRLRARAPGAAGRDVDGKAVSTPIKVHGSNPHGVPRSTGSHIVQAINEMQLYYYEKGKLRRVLPVVYGKPSTPTPSGRYRVYSKTPGPGPAFGPLVMWYHRGYGIHGTNQENLLAHTSRYYSAGCTRNYNENIRWLYPRVAVGTPVWNIRG